MKMLNDTPMGQRLCRLLGAQIKADYRLSLSLYPEKNATDPTCTHRCEGSSRHAIAALLGCLALITLACTVLRGICALLSKLFPSK